MIKNCIHCNNEFNARRSIIKYCSISCATSLNNSKRKKRILLKCDYCEKQFEKLKSKELKLNFCSRICKDTASRVESGDKFDSIRPSHYGNSEHYRVKALKTYIKECKICGYNKYTDVLEVDHIDNNHENNIITNLQLLCPTCHVEKHFLEKSGKFKK